MTTQFQGWAAHGQNQKLERYEFDPGPLGEDDVEIAVEYCGLCHSDVSVINNEWGNAVYPTVPGHEAVGTVVAVGNRVTAVQVGQRVGVGWNVGSCMHCHECLNGEGNLCADAAPTIIGHAGGFANRVRSHWLWAIPLPDDLDISSAGPLLCGGITVFQPFLAYDIKPTDSVGVVGIGGLGHMGLKFANAWGCEVTAFTSSESKADQARAWGAHRIVNSRDSSAIEAAARTLDMLLVTVNVPLDWPALMQTLKPHGRMHVVGAVLEPIPIGAFDLIMGQRDVSGSPTGGPSAIATMLQFAARHHIAPQVEHFPMSQVNDAIAHLEAGNARYRVVLDADF